MRKQTLRSLIAVVMIPMSFLLLHGLPGSHVRTSRSTTYHGGRNLAAVNAAYIRHATTQTDQSPPSVAGNAGTSQVASLAATVVQANGQILAQVRQIEAQHPGYVAPAAPPAAPAPSPSSSDTAAPAPTPAPAPAPDPASYPAPPASEADILACIRNAESGDDYGDTSNPYYRGAYQFSYSTWAEVGGSGDPAAASPAEQDMRAGLLVQQSGWGQWSTSAGCGAPV